MKRFKIINRLFVLLGFISIGFFFGVNSVNAHTYYDSGALQVVPEGSGLTAIGYGSDDKACTIYLQVADVRTDGSIDFSTVRDVAPVNCTNGPGNDNQTGYIAYPPTPEMIAQGDYSSPGGEYVDLGPPRAGYQNQRYAVGWTWGTTSGNPTSGGRNDGSPYIDDYPAKPCYYQEYASLVDIGNGNTANYKKWGQPYTGSCVIDGYISKNWLKRVVEAPLGTVIVGVGFSLANDGDVGWVRMETRSGAVPAPISVSLSASPSSLTLPSNFVDLTWATTGTPEQCTASGSWANSKSTSGGTERRTGLTAGSYTYTITCTKAGVSNATASVTVLVSPEPACQVTNFSANPNPIVTSGSTGNTTISANANCEYDVRRGSTNGTLVFQGGPGASQGPANSVSNGTVFYLQKRGVTNSTGTLSTLTVNLSAPDSISVTLNASPSSLTQPANSSTLTWTTTGNPTSCTGGGAWSGSKSPGGGNQAVNVYSSGPNTFTITCSKSGVDNVTAVATVMVNQASPISVTLTAVTNPVNHPYTSTSLQWSTSGSPTSCTASASPTHSNWNGSKNVNGGSSGISGLTPGTYNFTITCNKTGVDSATDTVTVTVNPAACTDLRIDNVWGQDPSTGTWREPLMGDYIILQGQFGTQTQINNSTIRYTVPSWNPTVLYRGPTQVNLPQASGTGSYTVEIERNVNCKVSKTFQVRYVAPISVTLEAIPNPVTTGQPAVLQWRTTGTPDQCTPGNGFAVPGWVGTPKDPNGGSIQIYPSSSGTYFTMTCTKAGTANANAQTTAFSQAPTASCDANQVGQNRMIGCAWTGVFSGSPTAVAPTGNTASSPVPNSFSALTTTTGYGGPSGLSANYSIRWKGSFNFGSGNYIFTSTHADGARVYFDDNNDGNPDGSYVINDWNPGAQRTTSSSQISVSGQKTVVYELRKGTGSGAFGLSWAKQTASLPTVNISANPTSGNSPLSTTITWTTTNATSCTASNGWTGTKLTGSNRTETVTGITTTRTFVLTCYNSQGNSASNSVTVTPTNQYTLTVNKTYGGYVRSSDGNIDCGTDCVHVYNNGANVTLTAYPDSSAWRFVGWQGDCTGTGNCVLTINSPKTVTAMFALRPLIYREF